MFWGKSLSELHEKQKCVTLKVGSSFVVSLMWRYGCSPLVLQVDISGWWRCDVSYSLPPPNGEWWCELFAGKGFSCGGTLGSNWSRGWKSCSKTGGHLPHQSGCFLFHLHVFVGGTLYTCGVFLLNFIKAPSSITLSHQAIWPLSHQVDDVLLKKDVALIIIFCPPSLHSQIAVKALGIGKHVVCGVPGGLDQPECLRMVQVG